MGAVSMPRTTLPQGVRRADAIAELTDLAPLLRTKAAKADRSADNADDLTLYETQAMESARQALHATWRLLADQYRAYARATDQAVTQLHARRY
jgi:ElaB/YqjD/DUF883 family membrane-anchored ribosome-binding protein